MAQFMQNLLTASIHGSVVILAVILLRLLLRKTPKKYICLLWLLSGIRLLMPIEIRSDLSLQPEFTLPGWNLPAILPWVWGIVAICFGLYSLVSYRKLKAKVREAVRIRGGWECDKIDTAFILGFIKPRIYIPMGMNRQARKHILEHERTHLDKGDHWIKMIGFLALALHWFNPLVWIAYILLCKDIEMACDERVVQFMELEERKSYSAALLSCSSKQMHFSANPVAFGEVSVKQRILSVLNYKKPSFWISMLGVVAFFFVAVCLVTSPTEEVAPVIVPAEPTEQSLEETMDVVNRVESAWDAILNQEKYHLFFSDATVDGSVGWQVNLYKDGDNTLWFATDHINQEGRMVLDGVRYKFIDGNDGGWVPFEAEDTLLEEMLAEFALEGKEITDIVSHMNTDEDGHTYESLTFNTYTTVANDNILAQPMTVYFDVNGTMTGMQVENSLRKGADIFSFSNWSGDQSGFNGMGDAFARARENLLSAADVHPTKLQSPTQDEERMKEWGILFRVDDDLLTRYGGEAWFAQSDDYNLTVHTDNEYWLEKRTDTGWEKLELLAEPVWEDASYTLGKERYTTVAVDWRELYGPLTSGTYRMGKTFYMVDGAMSCTGYAEFEIYYNESNSAEQKAAVERCYTEFEELKNRKFIHFKSNMGWLEETWVNNGNYLQIRDFGNDNENTPENNGRVDIDVRWDGIGYSQVRENPEVRGSKVVGMQLSTLDARGTAWDVSFSEALGISFYERSNKAASFPEDIGVVSDEMVRFVITWPVVGLPVDEASAQLTYKFDGNGDLYYMEYRSIWKEEESVYWVEVYDTSAEEIDAKIKPYTENLIVDTFSWNEAKEKYTDEEFNIRQDSFVNNGGTPITGPVDAAKLALKEYPNLGDYLSLDIFRDDLSGMWKVTIESYVDYQSTYAYRDIYLSDSGATQLLVYEGPIGWNETRK